VASRAVSPARAWWILMGAAVRTTLAYRGNLANIVLGSVALQGAQLLFIGVLLSRFDEIGGWGFREIALLFAMRLCAHAACTIPFGQHSAIDFLVNEGEYDRFLLRPASPFLQLITYRFNAGSLGDLALGLAALATAIAIGPVEWSPGLVVFLVLAILAGGLVEAGVEIALSGLSFRMRATYTLKVTVDNTFADFGAYPLTIFGQLGSYLLTFLLPLAFIAYLPATALLGRTDELQLPEWVAWASPLAGPLIFWAGVAFFRRQSRHYDSPAG
jgi:ABC-2 type transport system permease protein